MTEGGRDTRQDSTARQKKDRVRRMVGASTPQASPKQWCRFRAALLSRRTSGWRPPAKNEIHVQDRQVSGLSLGPDHKGSAQGGSDRTEFSRRRGRRNTAKGWLEAHHGEGRRCL